MNFDELPKDWAQRPVTDEEIFEGVIDLIVTEQSRHEGAFYLLLLHANGRLAQPMVLDRIPDDCAELLDLLFGQVLAPLGDQFASIVAVIAHPGAPEVTERDWGLRRQVLGAAQRAGIDVAALAVATPAAILTFPTDPIEVREIA